MGDAHTYGKGRIQSVFELQDGSALFVTVAKYFTPQGRWVLLLCGLKGRPGWVPGLDKRGHAWLAA